MDVAPDVEHGADVWRQTVEEASEPKGWLRGPFAAEEITRKHGPIWVPVRRFPVLRPTKDVGANAPDEWVDQPKAKKMRLVDDGSEFGRTPQWAAPRR